MSLTAAFLAILLVPAVSSAVEAPSFRKAQPVWAAGREREMNLHLDFIGSFETAHPSRTNILRVTGTRPTESA